MLQRVFLTSTGVGGYFRCAEDVELHRSVPAVRFLDEDLFCSRRLIIKEESCTNVA